MTVHVAPDVELIVVDYLREHAELVALDVDGVSTDLPPTFDPTVTRWVTVTQTDAGTPNRRWTFDVALDVNCWAPTRADAKLLANTASAVLLQDLRGTAHAAGWVRNVVEEAGPQPLPDTNYPEPGFRFVFSVLVSANPPRA